MFSIANFISAGLVLVYFAVQIGTVTVNPLCPTNKIAPHRRVVRYDHGRPRTFGAFYNLLRPDGLQDTPSSLQEEPQADDPDDCGEIEDYDENDLSSITPNSLRRQGQNSNRFFFANLFGSYHENNKPTTLPPTRQTRPPTGGYFGNNEYRPPRPQEPTDHVKPVHEEGHEPHMTYRPGLVGGPIGHIIGIPQVKPTRHTPEKLHKKTHNGNHNHLRTSTQSYVNTYRPHRSRSADSGIFGSFFDLLL